MSYRLRGVEGRPTGFDRGGSGAPAPRRRTFARRVIIPMTWSTIASSLYSSSKREIQTIHTVQMGNKQFCYVVHPQSSLGVWLQRKLTSRSFGTVYDCSIVDSIVLIRSEDTSLSGVSAVVLYMQYSRVYVRIEIHSVYQAKSSELYSLSKTGQTTLRLTPYLFVAEDVECKA